METQVNQIEELKSLLIRVMVSLLARDPNGMTEIKRTLATLEYAGRDLYEEEREALEGLY